MDKKGIQSLFSAWAKMMSEKKDYLIDLDSIAGDGDLGLTMSDGFAAANDVVAKSTETDLGKLIYQAGRAFGSAAPSSLGTLFAAGFMSAGMALKGVTQMDVGDVVKMMSVFAAGIAKMGKAEEGEKTVLDSLYPAVRALESGAAIGMFFDEVLAKAAKAAQHGFNNTAKMLAVHGRIATRGEKSIGILDPGAAVSALLFDAFASLYN